MTKQKAKKKTRTKPSWSDVKSQIDNFDRAGLIALIQSLYAASKENQIFLHSRFALDDNVLVIYQKALQRWLWPNVLSNQDISVSKAKKAISDYKKAVGQPEGLAELMVYYCEQAAGFSQDVGMAGESWFDALLRAFENALKLVNTLSPERRDPLIERLDRVRGLSHDFGYGVGDDMDYLMAEYGYNGGR